MARFFVHFLTFAAIAAGCAADPAPAPEAPKVSATAVAPSASNTPSVKAAPAQEPLSHCSLVDQSNVDLAFLERPLPLRPGVGTVPFPVETKVAEAGAFVRQGIAYLHSYVWLEAARSFNEAARRDPSLAFAHWGLARAYFGLSLKARADEALKRAEALAKAPRERRYVKLLRAQLGATMALGDTKKKEHEAYRKALNDALSEDPGDAELWVLRGNAQEAEPEGRGQRGKMDTVAFYEAAIARAPKHVGAHHYLVHTYENAGRPRDAVASARVYLAEAPNVPHAHHMLGHVLPRTGAWQEAITQFEEADKLHVAYERDEKVRPGDDWHHQHNDELLGVAYMRVGRFQDAERVLGRQRATPLVSPIWEGLHWPLTELLLHRGKAREALAAAGEMIKAGPGTGPMVGHSLSVEAWLQLGDINAAKKSAAAAEAAVNEMEKAGTRDAKIAIEMFGDYAKAAAALIDLHVGDVAKAGKVLLGQAKDIADAPSVDGWGSGLFFIERAAAEAKRAKHPEIAAALHAEMKRIDPSYTPTL